MDGKFETTGGQPGQGSQGVTSRGAYLDRLQNMVDGIQDGEKREAAQSALDEVGRDLGFEVAKTEPQQEIEVDRERDFERES